MFGRSDGVALRRIDDDHPVLGGRGDINVVNADPGTADDLESAGCFDQRRCHLGARANHQGVVVADDLLKLLRGKASAHIHLCHLGQDVNPQLINGIRHQYFRHRPQACGCAV